jgi:hypothetical protein
MNALDLVASADLLFTLTADDSDAYSVVVLSLDDLSVQYTTPLPYPLKLLGEGHSRSPPPVSHFSPHYPTGVVITFDGE